MELAARRGDEPPPPHDAAFIEIAVAAQADVFLVRGVALRIKGPTPLSSASLAHKRRKALARCQGRRRASTPAPTRWQHPLQHSAHMNLLLSLPRCLPPSLSSRVCGPLTRGQHRCTQGNRHSKFTWAVHEQRFARARSVGSSFAFSRRRTRGSGVVEPLQRPDCQGGACETQPAGVSSR